MGPGRLSLATALAAACAIAQGCTDGTTPDCSDAQCLVVSVVEAGGDGAPPDGGADDAAQDGAVSEDSEAGPDSASPDAGSSASDAAVD